MAALGALAAVAAGMAVASPSAQAADPSASNGASAGSDPASRERAFAAASAEYGVPRTVLEAVSYAQTRWDFNPGHSTSGGYGPMHLVDANLGSAAEGGAWARRRLRRRHPLPTRSAGGRALTGLSEDALRTDEGANIRGGAALLAATQKRLGLPTGESTDAGQWYAAVADASGSTERGRRVGLRRRRILRHRLRRLAADRRRQAGLARPLEREAADGPGRPARPAQEANNGPVDCPPGLDCEWVPAPYEELGSEPGDYGNHDLASRPAAPEDHEHRHPQHGGDLRHDPQARDRPDVPRVELHPAQSDGHIAQHLEPKDVGWHAGNWYVNGHSIGLEHEGFAATGAQWFSEPMYRSSARLVRYLAKEYDIPLDMQHIFGHDQIPGSRPANVAGMHWDPGPYWNWEHYFQLLGAPLQRAHRRRAKDLVPDPARLRGQRADRHVLRRPAAGPCGRSGTNFVYLHTAPVASRRRSSTTSAARRGAPSTTTCPTSGPVPRPA